MAEKIITVAEASRQTGVAYDALLRLVHARRVPSVIVAGIRRVRLSQVLSVIEEVSAAA